MEKKTYSKPVIVAERFEPQEYCTVCWYVKASDIINEPLYHDINQSDFDYLIWHEDNFWKGKYNQGEDVNNTFSHTDLPGASGCYHEPLPQDINDGDYYKGREQGTITFIFTTRTYYRYKTNIGGHLYNRGSIYFTDYTQGNVS